MSQKRPEHSDQSFDHRGEKDFDPDFADVDEKAEIARAARSVIYVGADGNDVKTLDIDLQNLSITDDRLLDMAAKRMSFEQMYDKLGKPEWTNAAKLGTRVRALLAAYQLDATEQKALLLRDLVKLRDIIFDQLEGEGIQIGPDGELRGKEIAPAWASAMVRLLKEWRSTIESMQADVDGDRATMREAHARIMLEAITVMFERFILRLEEANADEFSGIEFKGSRPALMKMFGEVIPLGFQHLSENVDEREKRLTA